MKHFSKSFLCVSLLFVATSAIKGDCSTDDCSSSCSDRCVTLFIPRSPGDNLVRQAHHNGYRFGEDCFYGEFSAEFRYQRNFKEERIGKSLFGKNCLTFAGSSVSGRDNDNDIIADNFGLSPQVNTQLGFNPRIENFVVDFQLYVGLDEFFEGLYAQFNAPLVHSKWSLRAGSCTTDSSCNSDCSDNNSLPTPSSTTAFNRGCVDIISEGEIPAAETFSSALGGDFTFGDMSEKWSYGRFKFCEQDDTELADFYANIGYNFYECPDYHFGAFARVVAPTGTELDGTCAVRDVFSPIIGHDHWRLGGGITAHAELYNCDDEHFINAYLEGYLVHMFKECQVRSFDFKDKGCMSRYMLLKEFDSAGTAYNNTLINAINFATRKVEVQVDVQGELLLEFVYNNDCGFSAGIGYNLYGRSEEDICSIGNAATSAIDSRNFGIRGCAPVQAAGYPTDAVPPNQAIDSAGTPAAITNTELLAATQSDAKITSCGTVDNAQTLNNAAIDGFVYINTCANLTTSINDNALVSGLTVAQESSSTVPTINAADGVISNLTKAPVLVTKADLDINSGKAEAQISHKIFGHLDYEWNDCDWAPYLRAGAEVEFARCEDAGTMNAWGVFFGGGVAF